MSLQSILSLFFSLQDKQFRNWTFMGLHFQIVYSIAGVYNDHFDR